MEAVEQGRLLLINESQISNSSFGGFHKYQKQKETLPIQTIKARPREEPLTLADAMPNDSLTVYLGGAGMAGSYIDDQVNNLNRAGIKNSVAGHLSEGMFVDSIDGVGRFRERVKNIKGLGEYGPYAKEAKWSLDTLGVRKPLPVYGQFNLIGYSWGSLVAAQVALYYADQGQKVGRPQKLSATPDLSGTVLPLCLIPNSASKSAPPFNSVMPKASACARSPA